MFHLISIFPPGGPIPLPPLLPIRSIGGPPRPAPRKPPLSIPPRPLNPPRSPPQPPRKPPGPPGPPAPAGPPRSIPLPPRIPIPPRPRSPTGGNGGPPPNPSGLGALHWLHSSLQLKFWLPQPLETEQLHTSYKYAQPRQHCTTNVNIRIRTLPVSGSLLHVAARRSTSAHTAGPTARAEPATVTSTTHHSLNNTPCSAMTGSQYMYASCM